MASSASLSDLFVRNFVQRDMAYGKLVQDDGSALERVLFEGKHGRIFLRSISVDCCLIVS